MSSYSPAAARAAANASHEYAPYIVYEQEHFGYDKAFHVRGPGAIEQYPWPTWDAAEREARFLKQKFSQGAVIYEFTANA